MERSSGPSWTLQQHAVPMHTILVSLLVVFTFLLLFTTKAAQQIQDSLVYAYAAKTGLELFHPHHLLYIPIVRLFLQLISPLCGSCDAVFAAQLHNILWATVAVASLFLILKQVSEYTFLGLLVAVLLLVTRGFWELSTQTTMYVPVTSCLALLVTVLIVWQGNTLTRCKIVIVTLLLALAVLYHQANVLFSIPLGYYLIAINGKRGWKASLAAISFAGLIVLSVYFLAFFASKGTWSLGEFMRFCFSYTQEICLGGQCRYRPSNWGTLNHFGAAGIRSFLDSLLWNFAILPERLVRLIRPILAFFMIMLYGWHIWQLINHAIHEKMRIFLLVWMSIYILFNLWWLPSYPHPFIIVLLPILLLTCLALKDVIDKLPNSYCSKLLPTTVVMVAILFMFTRNFYTVVLPLQEPESDSYLEAAKLAVLVPSECMILTSYRVWNHLRYYFDRTEGTIQAKNPLSFFHESTPIPQQYYIEEEGCVFVLASYVTPEFTMSTRFSAAINGYNNPSGWLSYIAWLFDFEYDMGGSLITSRKFEVINLDEGDPYIFISSPKTKIRGINELFQVLDSQINGSFGEGKNSFQSWLAFR